MKFTGVFALFILFTFSCLAGGHPQYAADKIHLESGVIRTQADFASRASMPPKSSEIFAGRYYRLLQMQHPINRQEKEALEATGLRLLSYVPFNTWFVSVPVGLDIRSLAGFPIRTLLTVPDAARLNGLLRSNDFPTHAVPAPDLLDLTVQLYGDVAVADIENDLKRSGFELLAVRVAMRNVNIRIRQSDLPRVLALPYVKFMEPVPPASEPEDVRGRSLHRSNAINTDLVFGRHYNGDTVTISLADDGAVGPHIDFKGRMYDINNQGPGGSHGDMTSGIAVGAGNLDPTKRGMADGATLLVHDIGNYEHIYDSPIFFNLFGAVITSTSYSQGCNDYNTNSVAADQLAYDNPQFTYVFSAGNRGQSACSNPAGEPWGTITGGMKIGKNVIACANLDPFEVIDPTSSHGPADDGRTKPEIAANGADQLSTDEGNTYQVGGGTSAACPGVAGVSAQLYQLYRIFYPGENPDAALIKGVLLNSAQDIGNVGPDFSYGYGRVNALRAVRTMEDGRYRLDSLTQGATSTFTITVPNGTRQLKVMAYWADAPGDPAASFQLVNDLDLNVLSPQGSIELPWILDPTPQAANLSAPAVKGIDHLNNSEQVTIDLPVAGTYTIQVDGTLIPSGSQRFYIVWDFVEDGLTLTYPSGGEGFIPGEEELLRWDTEGSQGTFSIEYSADAGNTWSSVAQVSGNERQYLWTVPAITSDQVVVRVARGADTDSNVGFISVLPQPQNLQVDYACLDSLQLSWDPSAGAGSYIVYRLGDKFMEEVGTTTTTSLKLAVPSNTEEWFSVAAVGQTFGKGRRINAVQKSPGLVNCNYVNDVALIRPVAPLPGVLYPCQNLAAVPLIVELQNTGIQTVSICQVFYSVNGSTPISELFNGSLIQGASSNFQFSIPIDFSVPGTYTVSVSVSLSGDQNNQNDTVSFTVTTGTSGTLPFVEDFSSPIFPPNGWSLESSGTTYFWERLTSITGSDGNLTEVAWFDNFSYNSSGAEDKLVTLVADLSSANNPMVTFDVAYAVYSSGYDDGLKVEISTDCGSTFLPTGYQKIGPALASAPQSSTDWFPAAASDWRKDTIDLTAYAGQQVILKFININDFGNNLLIDNIQLENNSLTSLNESDLLGSVNVYPNPFRNDFRITATGFNQPQCALQITDAQGRLVRTTNLAVKSGTVHEDVDLSFLPDGIYCCRLIAGADTRTFKVVKN